MSEANTATLGADELAAQVPALRAEVEALKAGLPTDKAHVLSALEARVTLLHQSVDTLDEAFSQLDARLTGRVNDIEARVTQQAKYLTEFAGNVTSRDTSTCWRIDAKHGSIDRGAIVTGYTKEQNGQQTLIKLHVVGLDPTNRVAKCVEHDDDTKTAPACWWDVDSLWPPARDEDDDE